MALEIVTPVGLPVKVIEGAVVGGGAHLLYYPPSSSTLVVTHIDAVFGGSGAGGELYAQEGNGPVPFWYTQPTGGDVQWDHYDGMQVFSDGDALEIFSVMGNFAVMVSGYLWPLKTGFQF